MKDCAVIDVGSNSVRLMRVICGISEKFVDITQLGRGLAESGRLSEEAMCASIKAIERFKGMAGDIPVYAFATEAVRRAQNGEEFIQRVYEVTGIKIDLLSPEEESRAGFLGACDKGRATVIDIGGASTEFCRGENGDILRAVSTPIGAVKLKDLCGDNRFDISGYLDSLFEDFDFSGKIIGIGGTITAIVTIAENMTSYDKDIVHGYILAREKIDEVEKALQDKSAEDLVKIYPALAKKRARVIFCGVKLLAYIMDRYGILSITVSDSDNTEGYLLLRGYEG